MDALNQFLESKGYACPLCMEVYRLEDEKKKPVLLTCNQHNLCIQCLEAHGARLINCPECRIPIAMKPPFIANSQVVSAMDVVIELWNQKMAPAPQSAAPFQIAIPNDFRIIKVKEFAKTYENIHESIENIMPEVVATMGWENVAAELQGNLRSKGSQWAVLRDKNNQSLGFCQLKYLTEVQCEVHWMGAIQREHYLEIFKNLSCVCSANGGDWKTNALSIYLNYDREEDFLWILQEWLVTSKVRHEVQYLHKHWGTQVKITFYPIPKPGHPFKVNLNSDVRLIFASTRECWVKYSLCPFLERIRLKPVFRICSAIEANPESAAAQLLQAFLNTPENFFGYVVNEETVGFIQFEGDYKVVKCGLVPQALKYADHFLQEYVKWTGKPKVAFDIRGKISPVLYDAIGRLK